jgi:glycosyltransferase involved in cell wall biosynthesis
VSFLDRPRRVPRTGSGVSNNSLRRVKRSRLLLAAQPPDGGVAHHLVTLVRGLPADRFDVDVACPRGSLAWESLEGTGVGLHPIESHREPRPGDARSWATLLRLAGEADVIHVHSAKAGFLGRLAAATRGRRRTCLFTPHGWSWWAADGVEARLYLGLERMAAHWCRTIVALSADERDAGLEAGVGDPEQYRVIPNGVPLERFALPRRPVRGRIVMVGRLAPPKRPDLAIRALAGVRERVPEAELQVVGDGPLCEEAEALAADLGLAGAVHFLGNREDVPELLAEAECALLASDYEGSPLAVVEAMAASVAVVATEVGGVGELVRPGATGGVAPKGDADALAEALVEVLADPGHTAALGAEGRRVAELELSLDRMVESLVALYDEVAL